MDSRGPVGSSNGGRGRGRGGRNRRRGGRGGRGRGRGGDKQAPHRAHHEDAKPPHRAHHDVVLPTSIPASGFDAMDVDAAPPAAAAQPKDGSKKLAHITDHKFAELDISAESRRAMSQVFKYEFMTAVQAETLPLILQQADKDCLAKAKTGTGKTLAFMIPTIERIKQTVGKDRRHDVRCLVVSPTRELAQQISTETEKLLTFHKPALRKVVTCVGGTNKNKDLRALQGNTPIVVATPGRLLDHLQNSGLADRMADLDTLVFDEADQLLDMGFRPDIERILRLLQPSFGKRQTLLFSATIPDQVTQIGRIAMRPQYNFVDTVGKDVEQTHLHVTQHLMVSSQERLVHDLFSVLVNETETKPYKIIVFFTTARLTGFLAELFNSVSNQTGFEVLEIHSRKSQKVRERASEKFRKSTNAIMFSSDVTARGMDYPGRYLRLAGWADGQEPDGRGGLLLTDYEQHHMRRELSDMPLEPLSVPQSAKASGAADRAIAHVSSDRALHESAAQAYRAWLGYYNGHLRKVRWDKKQLVAQANAWGQTVGLREQPSLQKRTVGKMGLKGTPGLRIEG
ncbi:hypothetical protein ACHAXT_003374 [Thalassiosira profunda]